jgi:hypothetical protein
LQLKNNFILLSPRDVRPFCQAVSIQDGHRESLQSTTGSTQQQQFLEAASRTYPPRLPTVGSGCGQQQLSQKDCSRRFGLDRGAWQAGLMNKCKLAEECRAASEKVQKVFVSKFGVFLKFLKSFYLSLIYTLFNELNV